MGRKLHLQDFSVECFGPMCWEEVAFARLFCGMPRFDVEEAAFAELFSGMLRPDVLHAVMKVSQIYTPHRYIDVELRHHTALCKSGINFRHGHEEEVAFARLFCGMLRSDVLCAVMNVSPIYTSHRYTETRCG